MASYLVKVQFGDTIRRLLLGEDVAFSFAHLLSRTRDLFQVAPNAQLVLTYVDQDGDVITMAEDQDLRDALVLQSLNPLRVSVAVLSNETTCDVMMDDMHASLPKQQRPPMKGEGEITPNAITAAETEPVHYGVVCDDCGVRNIRGSRYTSRKREDYDLCGKCYAKPGVNVNDFITIRRGRPDRRSTHFSRGGGNGYDSRNPNFRHHHHGFQHPKQSVHRRGRNGCPMGFAGNGKFAGVQGQGTHPAESETVHYGVTCDECNTCPIVGPRFKSNKKYDYDLCQSCMQKTGGSASDEYTRIDYSLQQFHPHMFMGKYYRAFPPYAFFPFSPYGRPRCSRRIQVVGVMPHSEDARETDPKETMEGAQAAPVPQGPARTREVTVPQALDQTEEVKPAEAVHGSDVLEAQVRDTLAMAEIEEVVMAEADGKDEKNTNNTGEFPGEIPVNKESESASDVQVDITAKAQEDVSTYEGMVFKLAAMGFTDNKLNEELLRKNNFDLRLTLDDLCAGEDWDPIIEELQEMGFYNSDLNRRLLFQNKGSVKRVVKELVQMAKGDENRGDSRI